MQWKKNTQKYEGNVGYADDISKFSCICKTLQLLSFKLFLVLCYITSFFHRPPSFLLEKNGIFTLLVCQSLLCHLRIKGSFALCSTWALFGSLAVMWHAFTVIRQIENHLCNFWGHPYSKCTTLKDKVQVPSLLRGEGKTVELSPFCCVVIQTKKHHPCLAWHLKKAIYMTNVVHCISFAVPMARMSIEQIVIAPIDTVN